MSELISLRLREFHRGLGGQFLPVHGAEVVAHYGAVAAEYTALQTSVGLLDLSYRSRVCVTGADRMRFLHGQVTNDIKRLRPGEGCYAALTTAKGRMQSDLNIFCLPDELLLDFEPGLTRAVLQRLEKYLVADDVQLVDVAPHYGLLSLQGAKAETALRDWGVFTVIPQTAWVSVHTSTAAQEEIYLMNHARFGAAGYDLFVPNAELEAVAQQLLKAVGSAGGRAVGWEAVEIARVEAGMPRFGADMDETHLASECGIEARAISYNKGCYIGQEVLNRIHTQGHVNRELRRLELKLAAKNVPAPGAKLYLGEKEVGCLTSVVTVPTSEKSVALGFVHREVHTPGTQLQLTPAGPIEVVVI